MHSLHCLNCEKSVSEQDIYCANCGQTVHLHPITAAHLVHDGLHFFLHADKSVFTLVKALATRTGKVASEFIAGKRKKYFSPFNFFMLVVGLVVLSMSVFHAFEKQTADTQLQLQAMAAQIPDPVKKAKILGIMQRQMRSMDFIKKYSNIISMVTIPLLALVFSLFYLRGKYNFTEHLVANMYSTGFTALVMAFLIIPLMSLGNQYVYAGALIANVVFEIVYRGIFYYRFMNRPGAGAVLKAVGVSLLAQISIIALTFVLIFWYMKSGMSGLFH